MTYVSSAVRLWKVRVRWIARVSWVKSLWIRALTGVVLVRGLVCLCRKVKAGSVVSVKKFVATSTAVGMHLAGFLLCFLVVTI